MSAFKLGYLLEGIIISCIFYSTYRTLHYITLLQGHVVLAVTLSVSWFNFTLLASDYLFHFLNFSILSHLDPNQHNFLQQIVFKI